MTDDEIREFVNRLEESVEFGKAKSHIEELEVGGSLRIRANRESLLSFATAFLLEAVDPKSHSAFSAGRCAIFESHEQLQNDAGRVLSDVQLFNDWDDLESAIRRGRRKDSVGDRLSLVGCALLSVFVLVPVTGFVIWVFNSLCN